MPEPDLMTQQYHAFLLSADEELADASEQYVSRREAETLRNLTWYCLLSEKPILGVVVMRPDYSDPRIHQLPFPVMAYGSDITLNPVEQSRAERMAWEEAREAQQRWVDEMNAEFDRIREQVRERGGDW